MPQKKQSPKSGCLKIAVTETLADNCPKNKANLPFFWAKKPASVASRLFCPEKFAGWGDSLHKMLSGFMRRKSFFRDFWIFSCNSMGSRDSLRAIRFLFLAPSFICSMTLSYGVRALSYFFLVLPVTGLRCFDTNLVLAMKKLVSRL